MLTYISNTRSVSASGSIRPQGFSADQGFQTANGLSNLLDDYNSNAGGSAAISSVPAVLAKASAAQSSQLSQSGVTVNGKLDVQSRIDPQGYGAATALASSKFEVSFSVDVATNFTVTGQFSFISQDHTNEARNVSVSVDGALIFDLNWINGGNPATLEVNAGSTVNIIVDLQVGARKDPLGDSGTYTYSFSAIKQ